MNTNGIGLGLFICKKIVTQFEGKIIVKSEPGKGSKFIFFMYIAGDEIAVGSRNSLEKEVTLYKKKVRSNLVLS